MAKFTFATGNAQRLRRIPFYLLGALATLVVPRTDRIWVFGSGIGPGEGALPLLRLAGECLRPRPRLVWLASTDRELADARALGLDAVAKFSPRGFWLTLRAGVHVVTHGQGDVNRYGARGGFLVQLWHGIPLKRLHLDSPAAMHAGSRLSARLLECGHRMIGRQIGLFAVSSELVASRIVSAFGIRRDQIAVTGDPRDDVLLQGEPQARRAEARATLQATVGPIRGTGPVVMYAPTWREGERDPAEPDAGTWPAIAAWLERADATLLVRNHPLGHGDYALGAALCPRVRLLGSTVMAEVTPILPAVDILVTDYSSMAFDFSLTGGAIVFLAADVDSYAGSRGLYVPYHEFTGGRHASTWAQALAELDALGRQDPAAVAAAQAHTRWLREEHFDVADGHAAERVLAEIARRHGGPTPQLQALESANAALRAGSATRARLSSSVIAADQLTLGLIPGPAGCHGARLEGDRASVSAVLSAAPDGNLVARFALLGTRWGHPGLPLPSGDYRLILDTGAGHTVRVEADRLGPAVTHELFRAEVVTAGGGIVLRVGPPLADDELGPAAQAALRRRYLTRRLPLSDEVFVESFYGRTVSDNPRAIAAELAHSHPHYTCWYSVQDRCVPIPPGGRALVQGSREWWRVRAQARLYVINDWLLPPYRRRRGQRVLQTWHGTMLKKLARDRAISRRRRLAAVKQSLKWSALLSQNSYSSERFRTSYAYRGPIWETGYPRNDVLVDPDRAREVRAALGVAGDARIVLYAPTWRDNRVDLVDHLDLVAFAEALPEGDVLVVRGHSRTLAGNIDLRGGRLVDATTYPDIGELMLVADVLVTDYSSVMFDFVSTDRPLIFYVPDLDRYGDEQHRDLSRGFYFDFAAEAPGPLVRTQQELLAALQDTAGNHARFAVRRAAWRERFTPHDDGKAAERVVRRMADEGWL